LILALALLVTPLAIPLSLSVLCPKPLPGLAALWGVASRRTSDGWNSAPAPNRVMAESMIVHPNDRH